MFILSAFDMTWDMLITPKRIAYARQRETELYESLMSIANCKQEEIRQLIVETINGMTEELLQKASEYQFQGKYFIFNALYLLMILRNVNYKSSLCIRHI